MIYILRTFIAVKSVKLINKINKRWKNNEIHINKTHIIYSYTFPIEIYEHNLIFTIGYYNRLSIHISYWCYWNFELKNKVLYFQFCHTFLRNGTYVFKFWFSMYEYTGTNIQHPTVIQIRLATIWKALLCQSPCKCKGARSKRYHSSILLGFLYLLCCVVLHISSFLGCL